MEFLYLLEGIRTPALDAVFTAVTELGGEIAFLVAALVIFWCVDKRRGYYLMAVGFTGTLLNQFLKITCRVPRPWVRDSGFAIVEAARADATGYSFPSGHSQNAVGTFGVLARCARRGWVRALCVAVCVAVPFSRMYLGVHYPSDVLVGSGMALALIWLMEPVYRRFDRRQMYRLFAGLIALAVAFVGYMELYPFPADTDPVNLASAVENSYTLLGALLGMAIVYYVDETWLHFPLEGKWYAQVCKVAGGLLLALAVKSGLKAPLDALFCGHHAARAVRYLLLVLTAGILWPMTFPWFSGLGRKEERL